MGLTVEPGFHCAMKDGSDRAIGFGGAKQPTPRAANLDCESGARSTAR
jgi:hypothetical protein